MDSVSQPEADPPSAGKYGMTKEKIFMKYSIQAEPSTTVRNKTGAWRVLRPVFEAEKCTACGTCESVCPDGVIFPSGKTNSAGKIYRETSYDFCKGCGVCAAECPAKAIEMKLETK